MSHDGKSLVSQGRVAGRSNAARSEMVGRFKGPGCSWNTGLDQDRCCGAELHMHDVQPPQSRGRRV